MINSILEQLKSKNLDSKIGYYLVAILECTPPDEWDIRCMEIYKQLLNDMTRYLQRRVNNDNR
jgi:hypothetical protein